jgi:hypothetical protein
VLAESDDDQRTQKLIEYLRSRDGGITARDLRRSHHPKYKTTDEAKQALDALEAIGAGSWVGSP